MPLCSDTLSILESEALGLTTPVDPSDGLLAGYTRVEEEILSEHTWAARAGARQNEKRLSRPATGQLTGIRKLHGAGISKFEIARGVQIDRASVRRILEAKLWRNLKSVPVTGAL